jgi:hypothetical protein
VGTFPTWRAETPGKEPTMPTIRASKSDVLSHVHGDLLAEAEAAAGANRVLSKAEQAAMPEGLLKKAAGWVREDGGPGTRVDVDAMVFKAARRMATLLGRVNQRSGAGAEAVSQREVHALAAQDGEAGARVARAYELITGKHIDLTPSVSADLLSGSAAMNAFKSMLGTTTPRVRGEIEIFNESGDNGVNTFAAALSGAADIEDAMSTAKTQWGASWGFAAWDMSLHDKTKAEAIELFVAQARGIYAEEDRDPAEVDPIIDAFAAQVQQTFGALEDVRLVTGATVNFERGGTYLFGKTSDGWLALAVRQYRDA